MRDQKTMNGRLLGWAAIACTSLLAATTQAAAPGITGTDNAGGPTFDLTAAPGFISQPDGSSVYSWGYGCNTAPASGQFVPASISGGKCPAGVMQLPGPTLIVNQGDTVTITLHNNLPGAAGNTSILFPGFQVCSATLNSDGTCTGSVSGAPGVLTREAAHGGTVTYAFVASTSGTHSYYSGTHGNLQIEMGLYGALIVLPSHSGTALNGQVPPRDGSRPARSATWPRARGRCRANAVRPAMCSPAAPDR